jgi:diaminohydroxyphosphoribosylaminopyrimidine deaminase/5-amino-6-(5-phosphoribosylamino)uracil reductase
MTEAPQAAAPAVYDAAMRRALALAANGPSFGPNPQVGCVLLDAAGTIVAEGWHRGAGTQHAEVDALHNLAALGSSGTGRPAEGLTAVVILEPCNHYGRTGPCSVALIEAGVSRVVYGVSDPGANSSGGAERLREAGIEVLGGVLADEVTTFLHRWLTAATHRRPYLTVKWASSLDGRAAADDGSSQWITGTAARQRVHEQRAENDAIIVGIGTVLADDPSLTARGEYGELLARQPLPVVIGQREVPADAKLRQHPAGLLETRSRDLGEVLTGLYERGIRTAYVEGGPTLASALIAGGFADEVAIYFGPVLLGGQRVAIGDVGVASIGEARRLEVVSVESLGGDLLVTARPAASTPMTAQQRADFEANVAGPGRGGPFHQDKEN